MRKFLAWLLLLAMIVSLCACGTSPAKTTTSDEELPVTVTESVQETVVPEVQETESVALEKPIFLKVSSITFSVVGETDDIYLGMVPRDQITWESDDPNVISVENGVLTALDVGSTTIRAVYNDKQVECTAACLAQTEEELLQLDKKILNSPTRILPDLDMEEPCTYFDDAAMVGDSITYVMRQNEAKNNYLGDTLFLCRGGASLHGFLYGSVKLFYRGKEYRLEDAIAASEVKRIYILIGASDIVPEKEDSIFFDNWAAMLGKIRDKQPDLEIIMISIFPAAGVTMFTEKWNAQVEGVNEQLRQFAADNDCGYLDLSYYIRDHYRCMVPAFSQDMHHLNEEGCDVWMKFLRYYAQYESQGGTLS